MSLSKLQINVLDKALQCDPVDLTVYYSTAARFGLTQRQAKNIYTKKFNSFVKDGQPLSQEDVDALDEYIQGMLAMLRSPSYDELLEDGRRVDEMFRHWEERDWSDYQSALATTVAAVSAASAPIIRQGRQGHASRRPARKAGTKASGGEDDGDGGDGEPPRHRSSHASRSKLESPSSKNVVNEIGVSKKSICSTSYGRIAGGAERLAGALSGTPTPSVPSTTRLASGKRSSSMDSHIQAAKDDVQTPERLALPKLFSYQSTAILFDCATQTIKNKVVLGTFPKPLQTPVGPRFTVDQIQAVVSGEWQPPKSEKSPVSPPPRGRGRPRIAQQASQGVRS